MIYVALVIAAIILIWCIYTVLEGDSQYPFTDDVDITPVPTVYSSQNTYQGYPTQVDPTPVVTNPTVDSGFPYIPLVDTPYITVDPEPYNPPCEMPDPSPSWDSPSYDNPSVDTTPTDSPSSSDGGGATGDF